MSVDGQLGLPDVEPEASDDRPLYFLTNRMNLNSILGSRLIAPVESFTKYYADLLAAAPGWVPLLKGPPSRAHLDRVTGERGSGSPVLIELPHEISSLQDQRSTDDIVYEPAIRLADATTIHLPDEKARREHRAREYANIHPHDDLLKVTPKLFSGDGVDALVTPPGPAQSPDWQRIDRIRGALNAVASFSSSSGLRRLASSVLEPGSGEAGEDLPSWLTVDRLVDLPGRSTLVESDPDAATFAVAYDVFADSDTAQSWSPVAVLDEVRARVAAVPLKEEDQALVVRNLQRVEQLVNAEVEFQPFRDTSSALTSAKALILVLLRPDLADLLSWPREQTGADDVTALAAAVLAGRLRGLASESTALRDVDFDDLTAEWAVPAATDPDTPFRAAGRARQADLDSARTDAPEPSGGRDQSSTAGAELVATYRALPSRSKAAARLRVARKLGWSVTTALKVPKDSVVESDGGRISIVGVQKVRLTEALSEAQFTAQADRLTSDDLDAALAALRPKAG